MTLYVPVVVVKAPLLKLLAPTVVAYTFKLAPRVPLLSVSIVVSPIAPR